MRYVCSVLTGFRPSEPPSDRRALSQRTPGATLLPRCRTGPERAPGPAAGGWDRSMRYVCCVLTRSGPLNRPAIGGHWVSTRPGRRSAAVPHRAGKGTALGTGTWPGSGWWGSIDGLCVRCADRFRPSELPSDRQALSQRTPGAALCRSAPPPAQAPGPAAGGGERWMRYVCSVVNRPAIGGH